MKRRSFLKGLFSIPAAVVAAPILAKIPEVPDVREQMLEASNVIDETVTQKFRTVGYEGNGEASNYVETGFKPDFVMIKPLDSVGPWRVEGDLNYNMLDTSRSEISRIGSDLVMKCYNK